MSGIAANPTEERNSIYLDPEHPEPEKPSEIPSRREFLVFQLSTDRMGSAPRETHVHVHPIRYHELEYFLYKAGLEVTLVFTNVRKYGWKLVFPLIWLIRAYANHMTKRSRRQGRIPLARIYKRILSDDILFGTHLIVEAKRL